MPVKKKPNKQHAAKGASFERIGKAIRKAGEDMPFYAGSDAKTVLLIVAAAFENEARNVSGLR